MTNGQPQNQIPIQKYQRLAMKMEPEPQENMDMNPKNKELYSKEEIK